MSSSLCGWKATVLWTWEDFVSQEAKEKYEEDDNDDNDEDEDVDATEIDFSFNVVDEGI